MLNGRMSSGTENKKSVLEVSRRLKDKNQNQIRMTSMLTVMKTFLLQSQEIGVELIETVVQRT